MESKTIFRIGVALALASTALSSPLTLLGTEHMSANEIVNLTWTVDRQVLAAWECVGQSCLIADTSGSTGRNPTMRAEGAKDGDIKCIVAHNPPVGELMTKYFNKPPEVPKQKTGVSSALMGGVNSLWRPMVASKGNKEAGTFKGKCTANILIFAKGTLEPGEFGIIVGPPFTSKLPAGWSRHGIQYDADIPGDYCLGLPGGMVARDVINQAAAKCPNSKLFVSGYSQGAMVIRNGLARASDAAKARVKVRATPPHHAVS
jgi:Cutinase